MTHIEHTIMIAAPLEQVFDYASDYRKWSEWFEGVSDFSPTTEITQGNGARYAYTARLMGVSASVETEVHKFVDNRGWTGVGVKGMPHRTFWDFQQIGTDTKFTYALEYRLPVPLLGSLIDSWFIKPQWDKVIAHSLTNLQHHFGTSTGSTSR